MGIYDASAKSINQFVSKNIERKSTIRTDGWNVYNQLSSLDYNHNVVNNEISIGKNQLPLVHLVASLLKRWRLGTHQGAVSHEHLEYYLDEFTFRFNRRTSAHRGKLFYRLMQNAVQIDPVTYKQLSK